MEIQALQMQISLEKQALTAAMATVPVSSAAVAAIESRIGIATAKLGTAKANLATVNMKIIKNKGVIA